MERPAERGPVPGRGVRLRPMRAADLPEVLHIERRSFSTPWTERTFHGLLRRTTAVLRVAEGADGVVGFVVLWFAADEAEIGDLAVLPEARRRGIGRLLLSEVEREARARRVRRLFLEVRAGNVAARSLYGNAGFRVVGTRPGYYREPVEDALVMARELSVR